MDRTSLRTRLGRAGVVLVVRLHSTATLDAVVSSAAEAGVEFVEVTSNTPGGLRWLESNAERFADVALGVGTVTDREIARRAMEAGADYLVAPDVGTEVLKFAEEHGIGCVPGALTPTEVLDAQRRGAAAVKLFPVTQLGPGYVQDLRGPLPDVPLIPIGGIDENNAGAYIRAGATAVGVGAAFVSPAIVEESDWPGLVRRLRRLVMAVSDAQG